MGTVSACVKFPITSSGNQNFKLAITGLPASKLSPQPDSDTYLISLQSLKPQQPHVICSYSFEVDDSMPNLLALNCACKTKHNLTANKCQLVVQCDRVLDTELQKRDLLDLSVVVGIDGEVSSVVSKPTAIWNDEKNKMLWKVGTLASNTQSMKFLAQWDVKKQGSTKPTVLIKYRCAELQGSTLNVKALSTTTGDELKIPITASIFSTISVQTQVIESS